MPAPTVTSTRVTPRINCYNQHFFAFTPECSHPCADDQFGVKGLSADAGFLPKDSIQESPLPQTIKKALGNIIDEDEVDKFLHINYEAPEIQAAVMRANMPLARIVVFCPPCLPAITTAVAICEDQENEISQWRVRVDHRLGCKCCPDKSSALSRIEMIADTIADVEAGNHWAKPSKPETTWVSYIDRAWLEQLLYNESDDSASSIKASHKTASTKQDASSDRDYAGIRRMLTFDGLAHSKTIAVILADVENSAWIINSKSFPVVKRHPRAGEMYGLKRESFASNADVKRTFMGTFATKGALKRRREDSPPPPTLTKMCP